MNKKILALLLTITAGSMLQAEVSENDTENHGFLASLGIGVKDIIESPAHIGQGGKKKETSENKKRRPRKNSDQSSNSKRSRRRPTEKRDEK